MIALIHSAQSTVFLAQVGKSQTDDAGGIRLQGKGHQVIEEWSSLLEGQGVRATRKGVVSFWFFLVQPERGLFNSPFKLTDGSEVLIQLVRVRLPQPLFELIGLKLGKIKNGLSILELSFSLVAGLQVLFPEEHAVEFFKTANRLDVVSVPGP